MRRALSILLVLFFGLGPLATALQASDDSRLPACCRRNGAHHCAMADAALARVAQAAGLPAFSAPTHCPLYPRGLATAVAPVHAMAASLAVPATQRMTSCALPLFCADAPRICARSHSGRGPPDSSLA